MNCKRRKKEFSAIMIINIFKSLLYQFDITLIKLSFSKSLNLDFQTEKTTLFINKSDNIDNDESTYIVIYQ